MATVLSSKDLSESRQPQLYTATIVTYSFAVLAVALRFTSRRLTKAGFWIDDWFMLVALVFSTGLLICFLIGIHYGYGKHYELLSPTTGELYYFQILFAVEILYTGSLCFVKYSILALYWRLFKPTSIRLPIWILAAVVTCWGSGVIITICLQCSPIQGFWDRTIKAKCGVNEQQFYLGFLIPNNITDVVLLILPMPYVLWLHRSRTQRAILCGVFLLGGFVCVASIFRLISVIDVDLKSPDVTWNSVSVGIWTLVEANIAIISACLPSLRPIFLLITTGFAKSPDHTGKTNPAVRSPSSLWGINPRIKTPSNARTKFLFRPLNTESVHPLVSLDEVANGKHRAHTTDSWMKYGQVGKSNEPVTRAERIRFDQRSPGDSKIRVTHGVHIDIV